MISNKEKDKWRHDFREIIKDHLVQLFWKKIDEHALFLSQGKETLQALSNCNFDDKKSLKELSRYKKDLLKLTSQLPDHLFNSLDEELKGFEKAFEQCLNNLPEHIKELQGKKRFKVQPEDSNYIKTGKLFKRIGYSWSKLPVKTGNLIRKIRSKKQKPLRQWSHEIQVKNLANYTLNHKFKSDVHSAITEYYQWLANSSLSLWRQDEVLDKKVAVNNPILAPANQEVLDTNPEVIEIEDLKSSIEKQLLSAFDNLWKEFQLNFEKAGTIEFPNRRVGNRKSQNLRNKHQKHYNNLNKNWSNAIKALQDDWEIDLELYELIYSSLDEYYEEKASIEHKIDHNIFQPLEAIIEFIDSCKNNINKTTSDKQLLTFLEKETVVIKDRLTGFIASNSENILNQDLPQSLDLIGKHIRDQIDEVSSKRVVVKGSDYTSPLKNSSISHISPYELINFECAPRLFSAIEEAKRNTVTHISTAQNILLQLAEIASFNLESAVSAIKENDDQVGKTIALTGLDRTIDQVTNIKEELRKIETELSDGLLSALNAFNTSIIKLTDNENILELRVRIMKGKATQRSKEIRNKIVATIKNLFPILVRKIRMYYNQAFLLIQGKLKKLGIGAEKQVITTELADFLAQTEEAIDHLPFVYQRLFRATPLEDENFFEGRNKEINAIAKAYTQWGQNRYGATIVVGEKGGGLSTLFNLFLKKQEVKIDVVRLSLDTNISTVAELIDVFNKELQWKIETISELAIKLKKSGKKIIILENLQRLYLKHVGGFDNIKAITELISVTNENIFWLVGCTEFSYDYLDKTILLSEDFGYTVRLENLSPEAVIELIERRHNVSGYNLAFEPSAEDLQSKRFNNLDSTAQRAYLKEEFFNELNKIAKSNISITLIYWLRSTKQTSDNTITISSLHDMDFSFMKGLSMAKLYVLHILLLHDGLSEVEVSKINNQSISQCRRILYPLFEDGIVVKDKDVYMINPLLYRQTINLLKTKNILH